MKTSNSVIVGCAIGCILFLFLVIAILNTPGKPAQIDPAQDKTVALNFIQEIKKIHTSGQDSFKSAVDGFTNAPLQSKQIAIDVLPVMESALHDLYLVKYPDLTDKNNAKTLNDALLDMRIAYDARVKGLKNFIDGKNADAVTQFQKSNTYIDRGTKALDMMEYAYE